jgi:signal transduction histidine kinase
MISRTLNILYLEDVEADAMLICKKLKEEGFDFQVDLVSTEGEYSEKLEKGGYDLILSDYNLPGYSGIAALMLSRKLQPDVPFICVSGTIGEDMAVELIQLGASDYILKDRPSRLSVAIERAFRVAELENDRAKAEEEMKNMKESLEMLNRRLNEIRENERAAISREIHDHLGQSLTAMKIDIQHLQDKMEDGSEEVLKLESMSQLATEMIRDVQRIAAELRPPLLDDLGLVSAMEWYIKEFGKRTGITCRQTLEQLQFTDKEKNLTLYRILQEALTNVSRHSSAKTVWIELSGRDRDVVLAVKDNGVGFDESKVRSYRSLGFIGIRERLKQSGGSLDIKSRLGIGTRLIVTIPVD